MLYKPAPDAPATPSFKKDTGPQAVFFRARCRALNIQSPFWAAIPWVKGVFHFSHFRNQVGPFNNLGRGIAAGQDQVKHFQFLIKGFQLTSASSIRP